MKKNSGERTRKPGDKNKKGGNGMKTAPKKKKSKRTIDPKVKLAGQLGLTIKVLVDQEKWTEAWTILNIDGVSETTKERYLDLVKNNLPKEESPESKPAGEPPEHPEVQDAPEPKPVQVVEVRIVFPQAAPQPEEAPGEDVSESSGDEALEPSEGQPAPTETSEIQPELHREDVQPEPQEEPTTPEPVLHDADIDALMGEGTGFPQQPVQPEQAAPGTAKKKILLGLPVIAIAVIAAIPLSKKMFEGSASRSIIEKNNEAIELVGEDCLRVVSLRAIGDRLYLKVQPFDPFTEGKKAEKEIVVMGNTTGIVTSLMNQQENEKYIRISREKIRLKAEEGLRRSREGFRVNPALDVDERHRLVIRDPGILELVSAAEYNIPGNTKPFAARPPGGK